eukprot:CFRG5741T1
MRFQRNLLIAMAITVAGHGNSQPVTGATVVGVTPNTSRVTQLNANIQNAAQLVRPYDTSVFQDPANRNSKVHNIYARNFTPPEVPFDTCNCAVQISVNVSCFNTIEEAVLGSNNNDKIMFSGEHLVFAPIKWAHNLEFAGVICPENNVRPCIIGDFDSEAETVFMPINEVEQSITFRDMDLTAKAGKLTGGLRGLGSEFAAGSQFISLYAYNFRAYNIWSERTGGVFFLGVAAEVHINDDCLFVSNMVDVNRHSQLFAGGAAISIVYILTGATVTLGGRYTGNVAQYPAGSNHANGGAIYIDWNEGQLECRGIFNNNQANQGGAVHVQDNNGTLLFNGYFGHNKAVDQGAGARAGAVRVLTHHERSNVTFSGMFEHNFAEGRGGAVASNNVKRASSIIFTGVFRNNTALLGDGGVWSQWSSVPLLGNITLSNHAEFNDNQAEDMGTEIIGTEHGPSLSQTEWKENDDESWTYIGGKA